MKRRSQFALVLLLLITTLALPAGSQAGSDQAIVTLSQIGHPGWKPVDMHVFTAPIGTEATGYAEFSDTMRALLPPPNHLWADWLPGIVPGAPHPPPYNRELRDGVRSNGYQEGSSFDLSAFSNGQGVWLVFMVVPRPGTTGSSPDFASGPIIPNSLFPMTTAGTTWRDGSLWNANLGGYSIPGPADYQPPLAVDGASHFPIFWADNADFGPAPYAGTYEMRTTITDVNGDGWSIVASFQVHQ